MTDFALEYAARVRADHASSWRRSAPAAWACRRPASCPDLHAGTRRGCGDQVAGGAEPLQHERRVDGSHDRVDPLVGHHRDTGPAEAAARHPGGDRAGLDRDRHGAVELGAGDLEVVAHRAVRGVEEPADLVPPPVAQRGHGVGDALDLGDHVPRPAPDPVVGERLDDVERGRAQGRQPESAGRALAVGAPGAVATVGEGVADPGVGDQQRVVGQVERDHGSLVGVEVDEQRGTLARRARRSSGPSRRWVRRRPRSPPGSRRPRGGRARRRSARRRRGRAARSRPSTRAPRTTTARRRRGTRLSTSRSTPGTS